MVDEQDTKSQAVEKCLINSNFASRKLPLTCTLNNFPAFFLRYDPVVNVMKSQEKVSAIEFQFKI